MTDAAKPKAAPAHPPFATMVQDAISALQEKKGSSRHAIKKYVKSHYKVNENSADTYINQALKKLVAKEALVTPKGMGGTFKLAKKPAVKKPKAKKPKAAVKKAVKKPAKKAAAKKKSPKKAAKKPAKKTAAKKVKKSPKKAATKAKKPVAKKTAKKPAKKSTKAKK